MPNIGKNRSIFIWFRKQTSDVRGNCELVGDRPLRRLTRECNTSSSSAVESSSLSLKWTNQ